MRLLIAAVGIVVLIVAGHTILTHFSLDHVVEAQMAPGLSVYELHVGKQDVTALPEQEAPLP
jgi:hypothetical protein